MKKPTTFKPMNLILAMFTNLVLFAQSHFEKLDFAFLIEKATNTNSLRSIKIKNSTVLVFLLLLSFNIGQAQVGTKFSARLDDGKGNKYLKVQGDIKLIGNTILTPKGEALPFNKAGNNNDLDAVYLDVDGDNSTTSSSSANLLINNSCKKIVFAGLYWSAMYPNAASTDKNCFNCGTPALTDWNQVKFKVPGGTYQTLTASGSSEIIFKGAATNDFNNGVYVCFKDVTSILQVLADADGTYTVGNLRATTGIRQGGAAGGWTLVVIYESPTVTSKYISVFDGAQMTNVDPGTNQLLQVDIPISGFQTLPSPFPVKAKIGVTALDGDYSKTGDGLLFINGLTPTTTANSSFTPITNTLNPTTLTPESNSNFFNATITVDNAQVTNRNPTSTNNLGFDIDYLEIPNPSNAVIPNGATQGTFRMFTNTTGGDGYAAFLSTFAVDIIEPKVTLTKEVFDYSTNPPTNVGGSDVTLGRELNYVIGFQNQGNDNATNFTITDILPINTKFNYPTDIDIASLPPGTTHSYNAATRTILFTIPNGLVEVNDPRYTIRFKVKVVESCSEVSDVCSNIIQNTALSNYSGTYNTGTFGDKSLASYTSCNIGIPQSTNFLVDVDDCKFEKSEILCGASIKISAANGYSTYSWSTSDTGIPVIGTGQTLTVVKEGVYYVQDTAPAPCLSIKEKVTVTLAGGLMQNPVIPYAKSPYAGSITICPDNGKELPNLFLCGANDFRDIKTGISGTGTTIVWEKLNEGSCTAVVNDKCANESSSCTWSQVATGPDYRADTKGQYRLTITYQNNCFNQFYFNVFKNELSPTETHTDIICTTNGNITINGVPAGYEYSLSATGTYQDSNSFTITTPGIYTVYIRQKGVTTNPCIFQVSNITVRRRDFTVTPTPIQPLCYGTKGGIKIAVNDVRGQYYYELFKGGTSVQKVGPIAAADYTFNNLDSGDYSFTVKTDDGCSFTDYYEHINETAGEIIATAAITRPLTDCTTGIIKITTSQDRNYSNSFYYFVNGSSTFQTSNEIEVTTAGTYTIRIVGTNNCEKTISIDVPKNPKPTYTVSHTNSNCYDDSAEIRINLTSATTGYTMGYSIDGGATYQTNTVFSNLQPGTYNVLVKYSVTYPISNWPYTETKDCFDPAQPITITGPSSAVSASAGVAELAGCGPLQGGQPTGLIRFTNVQGGTAPYQYSFDGGATWQASNEKYVVSSTVPYDLRVKDNLGCIYKIPYNVILDPKPEDPVIDSNVNPVFNCDGTATATVVVNTPTTTGATYTYEYYLKTGSGAPVPNTPITNNVFTNVPSGNHTVIVKYNITTVSTYSNLLQEDFGRGGDTTSPGINSAYCWEKQDGNTLAFATCSLSDWHPWLMNDGDYVVTKALLADHGPDFNWILPKDHTAVLNNTPTITDGRFLAVNIGNTIPLGAVLYSKSINDVIPNQDINVTLYMLNLLKQTNNLASPQLTIQLVKGTTVIASQVIPSIPRDEQWHSSTDLAGILLTLNPGNNTSLDFQILSYNQAVNGNDLAVDDILVYQIPKACGNEKSFPIVISTNGAFNAPTPSIQDAKCSGSTDGSITISASNFNTTTGFYYSVNNGSTWNTSTTSPVIVSGLGAGIYKVIVKNDVAGTCNFSFNSEVKAPQAILIVKVDQTAPTCTTGGTITVTTVTGGTGSYQYQLSDGSGIVKPFQSSKTFTNIPQGNYTVQVKDANNCLSPASAPITITTPTGPTATLAAATDWCYTPSNPASLVVTVTGGLAPYTYKLDSNTPINTNTFNNVAPGTHTILVTDSNNCTTTISNIIIEPQLQLNATLTQDLTCLVNASITTAVTGGYGAPYTYTVSYNGGAATAVASFPYTATLAGNYVFTVTDTKGCPATSNTIVVSPKTTPTLTTAKTDITCNNANNGTITVTAANGATTTYTYAIKLSSSAAYTTQATNQFTGLSAGTYNIKVIDSKGCESAVSNVTITNPGIVTGTISATELQCSASGTVPAVVTVTGGGGTAPYKYSFNGTSSFTATNTFSTSVAGTVTAYIQDVNNCQIGPLSVTISAIDQITDITITDSGYDCSTTPAGGHVNIAAVKSGVSAPVRYQIISGPSGYDTTVNADGEFKSLAPGSYVFQATDTKTNCSFTKPYTVNSAPDILAGGSVLSSIKCFGGTGTIQFTVNGVKDRGYDYVIKNAANTIIQSANNVSETITTVAVTTALPAGVYTITATDRKTKCTASYAITLTQPSAALSITSAIGTNVNCNNDNSQITVTATGGTPNYTYAFAKSPSTVPSSTYGSSAILTVDTNSSADLVWDVYAKDANGCIAKSTVTIVSDPTPTVTASVTNQCTASGSTFTITAAGTGGTGTLTYGINGASGSFQAGNTFTVASGTYTVWVKDGNGCTASATPVIVYPQLTASSAVTKTLDCSASANAVITTTITGGKSPYTYTVKKGSGAVSASSTPSAALSFTYSVSNANADTYTFEITDANGCKSTSTATVSPITNPTVSETHVNPLCNGNANGSVQLTGAGGSGGYTYSADNVTFVASGSFTGLAAGSYTFYVKDSKGCSGTVIATLVNPTTIGVSAVVTTPFSCNAANTKVAALITVTGSGGSGTYTYSFNNGTSYGTSNTLSVNDNGSAQSFNIIVKDGNGCLSSVQNINLSPLNPPTISGITSSPIYCSPVASTTSTVTVATTAGTGVAPLAYTITSGPVINTTGASSGSFTGLTAGTYTFKVTDANGCFAIQSYTVNPVTPIAVSATKLTDVDCFGGNTGSIRYNVSNFTTYSYSVNGGVAVTAQTASTFTLPNLGQGTYNVVFTDETTGCTAPTSITISQPAATLSATFTTVNANCNVATSTVTVTPTGGTPNYTYSFVADNAAAGTYVASNTANLDPALAWDVWIKDTKGCTFKLDLVIAKDSAPTVTATGAGCLGTAGGYSITAAASGGTGTLSYSINAGASYQASNTFTITAVGTYTIRVKDANGCIADSNPVIVAPQLTLSAVLNKDITCNPAPTDAQITLTPTGGAGPFTYTSSPNTGSFVGNVFTTSTVGNYTFTVTDNNSCSASTTTAIVVTPTVNPDITGVTQTQSINCNGDDTAAITITIDNTKGLAPFVFNVLNTTTGTDYGTQTSGLAAGNYTITVTDAKGCTDTQIFNIAQPLAIIVNHHAVPITCNGSGISKGSVIVDSVTGGVGPYDYIVTGVNGYNNSELNNAGTTSVSFNVVDFGLYQINVVDANGCSKLVQNVLVASPPDDLDITVSAAPAVCSGPGSAVVAVGSSPTSTIGTGPFYFSLYTGSAPSYPTGTWLPEDAVGSKQTTFTNLIPGVTYTFVVYDADAAHGGTGTGCYYYETSQFPIGTSSTITVNPLVANNITCKTNADGNVTFTINHTYGVATPVTYQIYNSQTVTPIGSSVSTTVPAGGSLAVNNFGSLPFGNYFVLITEDAGATNAGCSATSAPFAITESAIDLSITATKIKNVNCNEDGVIAAQAKDGTAPYTYQYLLASATAPTAATAGWISNTTFATSTTGNYIVYVKDAYGCIKNAPVTLDADDAPIINAPAAPICYDGNAFTITFSGTVDPDIIGGATYSVNGSTFQTSPSFTFNAAGTYNLVIKDGNGCTANVDYEVYPKLNLSASLTKELDCTVTPDAEITLTTTGGNTTPAANYTYEVSFNSGAFAVAANPYTATTAGNYVFRVTDANNATVCQTTTSFDLDPITPTVFTTTETNVSCNGGTDGTITVNVSSGVGPYEYQLDAGAFQTSNVFTGLAAGTTYTITVKDAKSCLYPKTPITITEPVLLAATSSITTSLTCGAGNVAQPATVTVVATPGTGTAPYEYSFDGGLNYSSTNTYQSYTGITFDVFVRDSKGCLFTLTNGVNIPALVPPTDLTFSTTVPITCLVNGTVEITGHTGGIGTLQYETIAPSPIIVPQQTTTTFAGLTAGTYVFRVTDANGCTYEESHTVDPVTPIAIVGTLINDISCNVSDGTTNNGSAQFTVTGFSTSGNYGIAVTSVPPALPFTQSISGDVITLTGLSAGTYTVTVTDNTTSCQDAASVITTEPALIAFTAAGTKVFCSQDISQITVSGVTGGTGAYTYAVVNGGAAAPAASAYASSSVLSVDTNLTDLTWDVYVKDANGCIHMENVVITNDAAPTIAVPAQQCYVGSPLTIDLSTLTTTYNGVKTYTVNGSVIASSIATFNAPGTYTIGIQDDNGCEDFKNYSIEKQLLATATLTKDLYCAAPVNATIDVVITDGIAPYSYQMYLNGSATGASTAVTGSTFTASVAAAGSYYFVISDSNTPNCSVTTNTVIVTTPTTPTATPVQTNVSCNGGTDGTITLTPANGITPYTYALTGPVANTTGDVTGIYTGLIAGSYSIVVTDAKGCPSAAIPVTITEPAVVTASAVVTPFGCDVTNAPQDAIVTITAGGGTPGYTYSFDNGATFQTSASFSVNTAQTINFVVHDANGCSISGQAIVNPYLPPTDMDLTSTPIYCNTPGTVATVTVNGVAGGAAPYTYEIISPAAAVTAPSATNSFNNLAPDTYIIKVTDNNGCSTTKAIVVEEADKISVTAQLINDVYCNSGSTGAANFTIANYITAGNYTFTLSPNLGTMAQNGDVVSYTALPQGNYTFTVTDGVSGCQASVTNFVINEPTAALSSTSVATNINCNNDSATITVTPSGGTAPYKYAVVKTGDPVPAAASFVTNDQLVVDTNNGVDVNWTVYVLDSNNCDTNNAQPILLDTNPTIASAIATQCPSATGTYDITVTATGFSTALLYSVDGVSYDTNNVITVNAPGVYNVIVKDANGCVSPATPVTIMEPLILTPTVTSSPSCTDGDGVVAVATTGGSGNYVYNIDGGAFGATTPLAGIASGTHTIGVRDTTTLCEAFATIDLKPATQITGFALSTTPVTCNGGNDGTITATMATPAVGVNDNPVYMYSLNGGTPQDSPIFSGLTAGSYTVAVISERGCKATAPIDILQPNPVLVNNVAVSQFVCTSGNTSNFATITVDPVTGVTGGSGTYTIYEFIKNGNPVPVQRGTSNTYTEFDLSGGSYTVNVYDSNGCMGTYATPITIDPYIGLDKINVINTAITCTNLEDITATAVDVSGTTIAGIQYTLTDVSGAVSFPSNTTGNFTGLPVGQYIITALNPVTGCSIQKAHYVNEPNTFDLNVVKTSDVVCYGSNEGAVSITLIDNVANPNEAGAFTYTVSGPVPSSGTLASAGPLNLTGLTAGEYTISATLSNSPFCPVSTTFTISQPDAALSISETHTAITCISGNNDGSISVTATGGWAGGYEYQLENSTGIVSAWSATHDYPNLTAETYTVRVRDTKGCPVSTNVQLVIPTPIVVTASPNVSIVLCNGDTSATITATSVTGGQGTNYSYTLNRITATEVISSGPQVSPSFSGLGAGTYSITVTDGFNCSGVSADITITEPTLVTPTLVQSGNATCLTQASLTLSATGGTGPYTYSADANFSTILGLFTATIPATFNVAPGDYAYYVKDANGCVGFISNGISVPQQPELEIDVNVLNAVINCKGDTTGVIVAKATGGLGNYIYTLLDNNGTVQGPKADGNFTGLPAGTYTVHVDSGVDCNKDSLPITISEPTAILASTHIVTNVTCNGNNDGKIVITATGGTGAIMYAISPNLNQFFDTNEFDNLAPGTYQVVVQDVLGCFHTIDFDITQPTSLTTALVPDSLWPEQCKGEKNGAFKIEIKGATAPYSVSLDNKNGTYVVIDGTYDNITGVQYPFVDLAGGKHIVYIKDAASCTYELEVIVPDGVVLNPTAEINYDCVNNASANFVTITVDASITNPADVEYSLDGTSYQASNIFTNVAPGEHYVIARHTNACEARVDFEIVAVQKLTLALSAGQPEMNVISVTAAGGAPAYEYSFNGEPFTSSNTYKIYKSGDYEVIVRDQNGCTATIIVPMTYIDVCIPNYFTPNGDGLYDGWGPGCTNIYNNLEFSIFDRYGRTIAKYHYGEKWDGKYNGEELPTGDYWYVLKLNDAKDAREFVGHFTLYR